MAAALDAVEDRVDLLVGEGIDPAELGVEVGAPVGHVGEGVVDLVEARGGLRVAVLHRDAAPLAEGHLPETVEPLVRVHRHGQRADLRERPPARREEVAHGGLDRGLLVAVPVDAQDRVADEIGKFFLSS